MSFDGFATSRLRKNGEELSGAAQLIACVIDEADKKAKRALKNQYVQYMSQVLDVYGFPGKEICQWLKDNNSSAVVGGSFALMMALMFDAPDPAEIEATELRFGCGGIDIFTTHPNAVKELASIIAEGFIPNENAGSFLCSKTGEHSKLKFPMGGVEQVTLFSASLTAKGTGKFDRFPSKIQIIQISKEIENPPSMHCGLIANFIYGSDLSVNRMYFNGTSMKYLSESAHNWVKGLDTVDSKLTIQYSMDQAENALGRIQKYQKRGFEIKNPKIIHFTNPIPFTQEFIQFSVKLHRSAQAAVRSTTGESIWYFPTVSCDEYSRKPPMYSFTNCSEGMTSILETHYVPDGMKSMKLKE